MFRDVVERQRELWGEERQNLLDDLGAICCVPTIYSKLKREVIRSAFVHHLLGVAGRVARVHRAVLVHRPELALCGIVHRNQIVSDAG